MQVEPVSSSGVAADEPPPDGPPDAENVHQGAAPPDAASHPLTDAAVLGWVAPLPSPDLLTALSRLCLLQRFGADIVAPDPLQQGVQQTFYQGPGLGVGVPAIGTHVGMTKDAGRFNGFNENFTSWVASGNAQVDFLEYGNNAAHAYNFSGPATLNRASELGGRVHAAVDRYIAATTPAERQKAARDIATEFGRYLHMVQDNWAHGGTDRPQHYGDHVDDNPQSMAAARRESRATFAELGAYLQSRGIDPATIDPGRPPWPDYCHPPLAGLGDKYRAPPWDEKDRMWDRGVMQDAISDRFNTATPLGKHPVKE
jgi:hypothetical protein